MDTHPPMRICVVGSGIVGSCVAFRLAQRSHTDVTLLSASPRTPPPPPPSSSSSSPNPPSSFNHLASAASMAWLNARNKKPRAYFNLNQQSVALWRRLEVELQPYLCPEATPTPLVTRGGELQWAHTASTPSPAAFFARIDELREWGYAIEPLRSASELTAVEPAVAAAVAGEGFAGGSFSSADAHLDVQHTLYALQCGLEDRGGRLMCGPEHRVTSITSTPTSNFAGGHEYDLRLASGETLNCDRLVVAAGFASAELAEMLGLALPQTRRPGVTLVTQPLPTRLFTRIATLHAPETPTHCSLSIRQLPDNRVWIHGGLHQGSNVDESLLAETEDSRPSSESDAPGRITAAQLLASAARVVPALRHAVVEHVKHGVRPMPADGLPVLGFGPAGQAQSVYFACMHSGVCLAPVAAHAAELEILDGLDLAALRPYRIARFQAGGSPLHAKL